MKRDLAFLFMIRLLLALSFATMATTLWWEPGPLASTTYRHKRRALIQQIWSDRLAEEATRDNVPMRDRILLAVSTVLAAISVRLKACCRGSAEHPHAYIAGPGDRVYTSQ